MALTLRGSSLRPFLMVLFIVATRLGAASATAQQTTLRPRITAQIDNSQRTTLVGSRPSAALAAKDAGSVDPSLQIRGISITLSRTAAQQAALDQLAAAQQNPTSPLYRQWLVPKQFAAQFGVADADIATVETWLEQQGFAVDGVSHSHNRIFFSGTAAQVKNAFAATLHNYKASGESRSHFAPSVDPSVPAALAAVIQGIGNLSNYRPHSSVVMGPPTPAYTTGSNQAVYLTPPDVATIYDVTPVYGSGHNGANQTIAIVGQSAVLPADLANFQAALGVPVHPQVLYLIPGTGAPTIVSGDETESDLDLEYSSAMAPGAAVIFYYVGDSGNYSVYDSIIQAVDDNVASIISISYGDCEPDFGSGWLDSTFEQAAVQGQTIVAAAGDWGSVSCVVDEFTSHAHQDTPAVFYPASSTWAVALGGTEFSAADVAANPINSTYWMAATDNAAVLSTALSYIPEVVWNDGYYAGGGGASIIEAQPLWQTGVPGIVNGTARLVPDISLAASANNPGYLICSSDTEWSSAGNCTTGFVSSNGYSYSVVGGTSATAPIFAGLLAVLNQAKGYTSGQGLINPTLYALASDPVTYASAFHDITDGGNNCTLLAACGTGPQNTVYRAGIGYDEASGLGSIDFANLVSAWPDAPDASAAATTTTLTASSTSFTYGSSVTLTATVSNGSSGNVIFQNGATTLGTAPVSASGVATVMLSTVPGGLDSITASYGGTTGYSPSTSIPVTVNVAPIATTIALSTLTANAAFGAPITFTATVQTSNGAATGGEVDLYLGDELIADGYLSSWGVATITPSTSPQALLLAGTDSFFASYIGTSNFAASSSTSVNVTVGPAPTRIQLTATPTTAPYGSGTVELLASVTYNGAFAATGGNVTFMYAGASIGTAEVSNGVAFLNLSTLPVGSDSITAVFGGTATCSASTSNAAAVNITPVVTTTTLTASTNNSSYGSGVSFTATVLASGVPATSGVVTFRSGAVAVGAGTVNGIGIAAINLSTLQGGVDSIAASYSGTTTLSSSLSNAILVAVAPTSTITALTASSMNPAFGSNLILAAAVTAGGSAAAPGVVTFLCNGIFIGSGNLNGNGTANISLSTLPVGSNSISAYYVGSTNFATSLSSVVSVTVNAAANPPPPATLTIAIPAPVLPGSSATAAVSLFASSSYSGTMNLSCALTNSPTGAQYLPTCSITPSIVTVASNTAAASILTLQTTSRITAAAAQPGKLSLWHFEEVSAMAGLLIFCVPIRRRRMMSMLAMLSVILYVGAIGCSNAGAGRAIPAIESTTAGDYAFTVKGTDINNPNTTTSTAVTITVQ